MNGAGLIFCAGPVLAIAMLSAPVIARASAHQDPQAPPPVTASAQSGSVPRAKVTSPHGPLSIPCQNCHTFSSWKPIRAIPEFNHDHTRYPLRGMHRDVGCTKCHSTLVFQNVSTHCADCHADIHRRQFGANCESCHSVKGWQVSNRDIQNHQNRFPLIGAHAMVECEACHKGAASGQFRGLSTACYSCHQQDFKTPVIDHIASGFPTTCESCLSMDNWFGAKFDHFKVTGFALTGMHATLDCVACHLNNRFKGTPASCYACHRKDFVATNNPPHVPAGLPHDCAVCHSTASWLGAKFDHTAYTSYPLTGMHVNIPCAQCHTDNRFAGTPTDCYSCHKAQYTSTTNPNHITAGFPTTCAVCHNTSSWADAVFNHNKTAFPLTGAHVRVACTQCHINNVYTGTPTDCYACHKTQYNSTTNPNHITAGFPTTCATCHNTTSWAGATFNHTWFNVNHGGANGVCATCHTNSADYSVFTCTNCHAKTSTDRQHGGVNGYIYNSVNCYACHKNAGGG